MSKNYTPPKIGASLNTASSVRGFSASAQSMSKMVQNSNSGIRQSLEGFSKETNNTGHQEAVSILLFQIALADGQAASGASFHAISEGIERLFTIPKERLVPLLHHGQTIAQNKFLSTSSLIESLQQALTPDKKNLLILIIDELIASIGEQAHVAHFFANKLKDSLS